MDISPSETDLATWTTCPGTPYTYERTSQANVNNEYYYMSTERCIIWKMDSHTGKHIGDQDIESNNKIEEYTTNNVSVIDFFQFILFFSF